jgi:hypothetical protein
LRSPLLPSTRVLGGYSGDISILHYLIPDITRAPLWRPCASVIPFGNSNQLKTLDQGKLAKVLNYEMARPRLTARVISQRVTPFNLGEEPSGGSVSSDHPVGTIVSLTEGCCVSSVNDLMPAWGLPHAEQRWLRRNLPHMRTCEKSCRPHSLFGCVGRGWAVAGAPFMCRMQAGTSRRQ